MFCTNGICIYRLSNCRNAVRLICISKIRFFCTPSITLFVWPGTVRSRQEPRTYLRQINFVPRVFFVKWDKIPLCKIQSAVFYSNLFWPGLTKKAIAHASFPQGFSARTYDAQYAYKPLEQRRQTLQLLHVILRTKIVIYL